MKIIIIFITIIKMAIVTWDNWHFPDCYVHPYVSNGEWPGGKAPQLEFPKIYNKKYRFFLWNLINIGFKLNNDN